MASSNGDSPSLPDNGRRPESVPVIDLSLLSQSELYALSLCSRAASNPRRCDDLVIPKIDPSVFNESSGSRKQTYSRIRISPPKPDSSLADGSTTPQLRDDPERAEDSRIISLLMDLMNGKESVPGRVESNDPVPQLANVVTVVKQRGRGRPCKNENRLAVRVPNAINVWKKRGRGRPRKVENRLTVVNVPNVLTVVKKRGRGRPPQNENRLTNVLINVVKKRGRGRPPQNENPLAVVNNVVKKRGRGRPQKKENRLEVVNNVVKKRGRGRPPKNGNPLEVLNVVNSVNDVKKRGRGRPKKYEDPLEVDIVPNVVNVLKRGRGRPPKIENHLAVVNNVEKKRGRGRPPKYENRLTVVEPVVEMPDVAMVDIVDVNAVSMDTNILNRDSNSGSVRSRRTREDGHKFRHRRNYC